VFPDFNMVGPHSTMVG